MKADAPLVASSPVELRNRALQNMAAALADSKDEIFRANDEDLANGEKSGVSPAVMKRLLFNEGKLNDCIEGITQLVSLPDPVGRKELVRKLDSDLLLEKVTCPIGIIGVIFEARPDALVQISSLCIKSGNCAVLKGGKETVNTNRVLFRIILDACVEAGLPETVLLQAETHNEIDELLSCNEQVDLLIPRGSNEFVAYIMDNTKIPVLGHADGICHIYVHEKADMGIVPDVLVDAKTQYAAACNAVETILVDRSIAKDALPVISDALVGSGVMLRGDSEVRDIADMEGLTDRGYCEYLDLVASVKLVDGIDEAIAHINRYGSHHTDCILTEDEKARDLFMDRVDSAGVYCNCSTRFADGFRYGFGAEVGISTGKIHARGPVGLDGLVTYKYRLYGNGTIVGDYASGKRTFDFEDLEG